MRPRDGFTPNRPQQEEGMRIEPPPSLAWAKGTTPAATAAAAPPEDPPEDREGSHGLRVAPKARGSVVGRKPASGVADLPITLTPDFTKASTSGSWCVAGGAPRKAREPTRVGRPMKSSRSLIRKGTPANGPPPGPPWPPALARASARSKSEVTMKFSFGCSRCARSMAAWAASTAESRPERIIAAVSVASGQAGLAAGAGALAWARAATPAKVRAPSARRVISVMRLPRYGDSAAPRRPRAWPL